MVPMSVLRFQCEGFNRFDMDGLSYQEKADDDCGPQEKNPDETLVLL
jgi:hypothetical protein